MGGQRILKVEQDSIDLYGLQRTLTLDLQTVIGADGTDSTYQDALDHAGWLLSKLAWDRPQVKVTINPRASQYHLIQVLDRDIGDKVRLTANHKWVELGLVDQDMFIENISHEYNQKGEWTVVWGLSAVALTEPFAVTGVTKFDEMRFTY